MSGFLTTVGYGSAGRGRRSKLRLTDWTIWNRCWGRRDVGVGVSFRDGFPVIVVHRKQEQSLSEYTEPV